MIARQLLTDGILPLKTSDTGRTALSWMEDLRVMHLPIVNNEGFLGLVSEFDIYASNNFDEALGNHQLSLIKPYVNENQHIYDAMRLMHAHHLTIVPVVDDHENYLGSITLQSLLEHFAEAFSMHEPGAVLVLEMSENDFVLSEIARLAEANDTKILSHFVKTFADTKRIEITLKFNRLNINGLIQTFLRYNYHIVTAYNEQNDNDDLQDRFDALMNYLNI